MYSSFKLSSSKITNNDLINKNEPPLISTYNGHLREYVEIIMNNIFLIIQLFMRNCEQSFRM